MDDLPSQAPVNDIPPAVSQTRRIRRWSLGMFVLLIASLAASVVLVGQQQELRRRAAENDAVSRADAATLLVNESFFDSNIPALPPPTFDDVPFGHPQFNHIESIAAAGISSGCVGGDYCPNDPLKRDEAAVYILRGMYGADYVPPNATGLVFSDVPITYWAAAWIEQLYTKGITAGCGGGNYCPDDPLTRADAAIFFLRAEHFPLELNYLPPPATGEVFSDVKINDYAADWIEQLYAEGITAGCGGGNYCPNDPLKRADAAVFEVRTFDLQITNYNFINYTDVPVTHSAYADIYAITSAGITDGCLIDPDNPLYCPDIALTRAEAAVFLLRAEHGGDYVPLPGGDQIFDDVAPGYWAYDWINQFYNEGITHGYGDGNYGPNDPTLVGQWNTFVAAITGETPTPTPVETLIVCPEGSSDIDCTIYFGAPGIQDAIDDAPDGATVLIKNGNYPNFTVTIGENPHPAKHNLTIEGESTAAVLDGAGQNADGFHVFDSSIAVNNLTIKNSYPTGISLEGASTADIMNNILSGNHSGIALVLDATAIITGNTIFSNNSYGIIMVESASATITGNTIFNNGLIGIIINSTTQATIGNNTIYGNLYQGLYCYEDSRCTAVNNLSVNNQRVGINGETPENFTRLEYNDSFNNAEGNWNQGFGWENWPPATNISVDPLFVDPDNGNFQLQPESPACEGGEGGTHMGALPCAGGEPTPTPTPTSAGTPTPTPTPPPGAENFSGFSSSLAYPGPATFNFTYSGSQAGNYSIYLSTDPNMATDVYINFASGPTPPLVEINPHKWGKYIPDAALYWQVYKGSDRSQIQSAAVAAADETTLVFKIRLEGITTGRPSLPLTVTLKQNNQTISTFTDVWTTADYQGIYSAYIMGFDPGTYDIVIKAPSHLARKFENIVLSQGANSQDFRQYRKMR